MARALLFVGGQQVELAEEVHREAKANDLAIDQSIRDTPPRRDAVAILADGERPSGGSRPRLGSDDEQEARADVDVCATNTDGSRPRPPRA